MTERKKSSDRGNARWCDVLPESRTSNKAKQSERLWDQPPHTHCGSVTRPSPGIRCSVTMRRGDISTAAAPCQDAEPHRLRSGKLAYQQRTGPTVFQDSVSKSTVYLDMTDDSADTKSR